MSLALAVGVMSRAALAWFDASEKDSLTGKRVAMQAVDAKAHIHQNKASRDLFICAKDLFVEAKDGKVRKGKSLRCLRKCRFSYIDTSPALPARRHLTAALRYSACPPHRPSCLHLGCQTRQTWCAP